MNERSVALVLSDTPGRMIQHSLKCGGILEIQLTVIVA